MRVLRPNKQGLDLTEALGQVTKLHRENMPVFHFQKLITRIFVEQENKHLKASEIFDILETDRLLNDNPMITKKEDLKFTNMRYAKLIHNEIQKRKNL